MVFVYDLSDNSGSGNTVELEISDDAGATWTVPATSVTGDMGTGITAGTGRSITWGAGTDFNNQEQADMRVRIRGTDKYANIGNYTESANFTVDTKGSVVSAVTASQTAGTTNIVVNYTLTDITAAGHVVTFNFSDDGGLTWTVPAVTVSGNVGVGQTIGSKTFTWNAGADFDGQDLNNMRVRVRSSDHLSELPE